MLTAIEHTILSLISRATKDAPIKNIGIARNVFLAHGEKLSERRVKQIIRELKDQNYPILASRRPPYGYFWARSLKEIDDYIRVIRAQALSELTMCEQMKKHLPKFAGQQDLNLSL